MARTITVEHNGTTYYGQVARIESTRLGTEDHGILTAYLHVKGDGWGVGVGGYGLDEPYHDEDGKFLGRRPTAYGLDHIVQMARTVGASSWEALPGKDVLILNESQSTWGSTPVGIAHISDESRVLIFKDHAAEWISR